jgi:hypothetical protein
MLEEEWHMDNPATKAGTTLRLIINGKEITIADVKPFMTLEIDLD